MVIFYSYVSHYQRVSIWKTTADLFLMYQEVDPEEPIEFAVPWHCLGTASGMGQGIGQKDDKKGNFSAVNIGIWNDLV